MVLADVDFEVIAHLGNFRNIDLPHKGIYRIQITLHYGSNVQKIIAPVGMFSSPSTLASKVDNLDVPAGPLLSMCEVDDRKHLFMTRSLIIRYQDETHDLNDGVHWRFTLPKLMMQGRLCDTVEETQRSILPTCPQHLHLKFELQFCPLLDVEDGQPYPDIFNDIHLLLPEEPEFKIIATQMLQISHASSGIHEYFPIDFFMDGCCCELDSMVHISATSIRYPMLKPRNISTLHNPTTGTGQEVEALRPKSTVIDQDTAAETNEILRSLQAEVEVSGDSLEESMPKEENTEEGQNSTVRKFSLHVNSYSTLLEGENGANGNQSGGRVSALVGRISQFRRSIFSAAIGSNGSTTEDSSTRESQNTNDSVHASVAHEASKRNGSITSTTSSARSVTTQSTDERGQLSAVNQKEDNLDGGAIIPESPEELLALIAPPTISNFNYFVRGTEEIMTLYLSWKEGNEGIVSASAASPESQIQNSCLLEIEQKSIVSQLEEETSVDERIALLHEKVELCNAQLSMRWSLLLQAIRRVMHDLCRRMKKKYQQKNVLFWRGQMLVQTCSFTGSTRFQSDQEQVLLKLIHDAMEEEASSAYCNSNDAASRSLQRHKLLNVFDGNLHKDVSKLPYFILQQYVGIKSKMHSPQAPTSQGVILNDSENNTSTKAMSQQDASTSDSGKGVGRDIGPCFVSPFKVAGSRLIDAVDAAKGIEGILPKGTMHLALGGFLLEEVGANIGESSPLSDITPLEQIGEISTRGTIRIDEIPSLEPIFSSSLCTDEYDVVETRDREMSQDECDDEDDEGFVPQSAVFSQLPGTPLVMKKKLQRQQASLGNESQVEQFSPDAMLSLECSPPPPPDFPGVSKDLDETNNLADAESLGEQIEKDMSSDRIGSNKFGWSTHRGEEDADDEADASTGSSSVEGLRRKLQKEHRVTFADVDSDGGKYSASTSRGPHLVVLQHGFLGHSVDMDYIADAIRLLLPSDLQLFSPRSNIGKESDSIAVMGKRLAFELIQHIKTSMPDLLKQSSGGRVSFIGHSMGGLIVRAALAEKEMKPLWKKFHSYISLAVPHLGTQFGDSSLVSTGMWALFKWKKYKALKELVLEDAISGRLNKSFLFKLSENKMLEKFQKVILVSSPFDQYVPYYSARIQTVPRIESDERMGVTVTSMMLNILSALNADQLVRVTMHNNIGDAVDVNSIIGRTAHICYLSDPLSARALIETVRTYLI